MASKSVSASICASTGASPDAAATCVGTGHSTQAQPPANRDLVVDETATGPSGTGGAEDIFIGDEQIGDDGACIAEVEPTAKRAKKPTSKVWNHFTKSTVTHKDEDGVIETQLWAHCNLCSFKTRCESTKGTKSLWNHLKLRHSIEQDQQQSQTGSGDGNTQYKYDPEVSLKKFHLVMVMHDYPFTMAEHEFFVDFVKSLRPGFSLNCRTTARKQIMEMFSVEKKRLLRLLKTLHCRFSATMDMWTSNQNKGYMCITIHWIDDNWQMQKRIACLFHVKGSHNGGRLAVKFVKGMMSWNIETRLFALTLDNAASNNKCVRIAIRELNKLCKDKKSPPLICEGVFFHVRCLCHILNLVAQDGLKTIGNAVKKIRAIIVIVKNSPLQWDEFQKCAEFHGLDNKSGLPLDVPTRWNSTYDMLRQAIYYRRAFQRLVYLNKEKYAHCAPSIKEWDMAESLCKCLQKLNDAVVLFFGCQYPTTNLFWRKFCEIKLAFREWCTSADITIATMADAMQVKYDKYWEKSNIALAVACFLDPGYKKRLLEYFPLKIYDERGAAAELNRYMDVLNKLFNAYCSNTHQSRKPNDQVELNVASHGPDDDADIEEFLYDDVAAIRSGEINELDAYMKKKPFQWVDPTGQGAEFDILSWWKLNQNAYPILSRLACDVLAVQVSTVTSESAFSSSGRIISSYRSRLDPEVVEALVYTKDWTRTSKKGHKGTIASFLNEFDDKECKCMATNANGNEDQIIEDAEQESDEDSEECNILI